MRYYVVTIKANGDEERLKFDGHPTLEQMQALVGGYIEHLDVDFEGKRQHMLVNEEGLFRGLPVNTKATMIALRPIVGDVFIIDKMK